MPEQQKDRTEKVCVFMPVDMLRELNELRLQRESGIGRWGRNRTLSAVILEILSTHLESNRGAS